MNGFIDIIIFVIALICGALFSASESDENNEKKKARADKAMYVMVGLVVFLAIKIIINQNGSDMF